MCGPEFVAPPARDSRSAEQDRWGWVDKRVGCLPGPRCRGGRGACGGVAVGVGPGQFSGLLADLPAAFTVDSYSHYFRVPKAYAVVRLRGRLYRNRSRYFAPVSRRSIN